MPLTTQTRADLLNALQPHVAAIAEDLRVRLLEPASPADQAGRAAAERLHDEEGAGDAFKVWLDLLGRRAAVLWVLKHIYVRVLEDRQLIRPRLIDPQHQSLFHRLAPSLGETAFSRWVFRDLAQPHGGLPELFSPQPAEVLPPADAHTRALLALLRMADPDTGERTFDFADERFDGQLLGDLYQELDPVVKERFALLQTPDFVRSFMLDRTLGEALKVWEADEIRVLDPACGSGHFLIDALRRLVQATAAQHPDWPRTQVVQSALSRVVGIDLNDYAAALARARLLMTALELSEAGTLEQAGLFQPQVFWADGLEQVERGEQPPGTQLVMGTPPEKLARSVLTPAATRAVLRPLLTPGFQVVVANPPYITEKDKARKKYHKEKLGSPKRPRYLSAHRQYSLGSPFTERCFQLAADDGFVGIINGNAFAKREFGAPLVEKVLARQDLSLVVDTSGAYIPGHGTPTILVFGRRRPPQGDTFTAVLGKRGEPSNPEDGAKGKVWSAIVAGWDRPGLDSPFVSTEEVERKVFAVHPWSLRGGGALGLQQVIEARSPERVQDQSTSIGFVCITKADDVFVLPPETPTRLGIESDLVRGFGIGENVRDWACENTSCVVFPYSCGRFTPVRLEDWPGASSYLWRFRTGLGNRAVFGGNTFFTSGREWWIYGQMPIDRLRTPSAITFAFVATHNHFVLDRGGKVFNRTAPVIKLPPDATEDDHLALLGPLNSSAACFWMKQVFFDKGRGGYGGGIASDLWEVFYEFDSTKLARFPLPPDRQATLPWARALDALGQARAEDTVASALSDPSWTTAADLRRLLSERRERDLLRLREMVGLQEELDWLVYRLYGLVPDDLPVLDPEQTPPVTPGLRPFELTLAHADAAARAALARGEPPDEAPTAWFSRHGWEPVEELPPDVPASWAELVRMRQALTAKDAHLQLLEAPVHKRRWYKPRFADEEQAALRIWMLDRLEETLRPLPHPATPQELARKLAGDARFLAAASVITDTEAVDLGALCAELMAREAVAAHPVHRYTPKGLVKRRVWEKTWALQAKEDQGEAVGPIPVPPRYTGADFLGSTAYGLRGKLDVPKERFVAHTEVPTADGGRRAGERALYGWAGWTRLQRLERLFDLLELLDDEGVPDAERVALHDLMFRYADELGRTDPRTASDLRADLRGEASGRPTEAQLAAWLHTHPATGRW